MTPRRTGTWFELSRVNGDCAAAAAMSIVIGGECAKAEARTRAMRGIMNKKDMVVGKRER